MHDLKEVYEFLAAESMLIDFGASAGAVHRHYQMMKAGFGLTMGLRGDISKQSLNEEGEKVHLVVVEGLRLCQWALESKGQSAMDS